MPYITKEDRVDNDLYLSPIHNPGILNYQITCLLNNYLMSTVHRYKAMNDILGALEGAKLEFYRRVVVPYEDQKIKENGDVY